MARFTVKFQIAHKGQRPMGVNSTSVTASNMWEAREVFKSTHYSNGDTIYKIISCVKTGK
jgi:hypothetical protein